MKVVAATQKGLHKAENEDCVIVDGVVLENGLYTADFDSGIVAIADGVGGRNAGAVASRFVAEKLCELDSVTLDAMQRIHDELLFRSEQKAELSGMATTLSGVMLRNDKMQVFSIGNTRVYLLQGGAYLKQLTTDDTTMHYLLMTGQLLPEEAESFTRKNEITACFGGNKDLFHIKIMDEEQICAPILITSDGIHDYLSLDQMEEIIGECGLGIATCEKLMNLARESGSVDDMSVLIASV